MGDKSTVITWGKLLAYINYLRFLKNLEKNTQLGLTKRRPRAKLIEIESQYHLYYPLGALVYANISQPVFVVRDFCAQPALGCAKKSVIYTGGMSDVYVILTTSPFHTRASHGRRGVLSLC